MVDRLQGGDSNEIRAFSTLKNTEENGEDSTNMDHTFVEGTYQMQRYDFHRRPGNNEIESL